MTERISELLNRIPGYTGYRQKESMRDDDRRLREEIARGLQQAVSDLSSVGSKLAANRQLDQISTVENTVSRLRHLESRVRTATYGYGGIFSDRDVDSFALTQLKQFDVAFQARVAALTERVSAVTHADSVDASALNAIDQELDTLNKLFDTRSDVIETASPTRDPDVLALLEAPRELTPQQRQLLNVRRGGTGAILGDNFQFTSHVALSSSTAEPVLTLVELDNGPEWLAVVDDGTQVTAWRVKAQDDAATSAAGQPASASVSGPQGSKTDVPASWQFSTAGTGDDANVEIHVAVAGSNRAYRGSSVSLLDLQVFSEGPSA